MLRSNMSFQLNLYLPLYLDTLYVNIGTYFQQKSRKWRNESGDIELIYHHGYITYSFWSAVFPGMQFYLSSLFLMFVSVDSFC